MLQSTSNTPPAFTGFSQQHFRNGIRANGTVRDDAGPDLLDRIFGEGEINSWGADWGMGLSAGSEYIGNMFASFGRMGRTFVADAMELPAIFRGVSREDAQVDPFGADVNAFLNMPARVNTNAFIGSSVINTMEQSANYFYGVRDRWARRNSSHVTTLPALPSFTESPGRFAASFLDPRRAYSLIAQGLPTTAGMMAAAMISRGGSFVAMASSEGEGFLRFADEYEQRTGRQLSNGDRIGGALTIGLGTALLERYGIERMIASGARGSLRANLLHALTIGAAAEGGTEFLQESLALGVEGFYQDTGKRWALPANTAERLSQSFLGGVLLGGGIGSTVGLAGAMSGSPDADAVLVGFSPDEDGIIQPLFRSATARVKGQVVTAQQLRDKGLRVPDFHRQLFVEQVLAAQPSLTRSEVNTSLIAIDARARLLGVTAEEMMERDGLVVTNQLPEAGTHLWQVGTVVSQWPAQMQARYYEAVRALSAGLSESEVAKATGWIKGPDGKWEFSVPESEWRVTITERVMKEAPTIADVLPKNSLILRAYPELASIPVEGITDGLLDENAVQAFVNAKVEEMDPNASTDGHRLKIRTPVSMTRAEIPERPPIWYSRFNDEMQVGGRLQKVQPASQVVAAIEGLLKQGKFVRDEYEWSEVKTFLEAMGDNPVSRDEVLEYIANGGVRLEEVVLSKAPFDHFVENIEDILPQEQTVLALVESYAKTDPEYAPVVAALQAKDLSSLDEKALQVIEIIKREYARYISDFRSQGNPEYLERLLTTIGKPELLAEIREAASNQSGYDLYTLDGQKENYREFLLKTPPREFERRSFSSDLAVRTRQNARRALLNSPHALTSEQISALEREMVIEEVGDPAPEIVLGETGDPMTGKLKHFSPHENILAHVRVSDRVDSQGRRVLFVEEVQSDWVQPIKESSLTSHLMNLGIDVLPYVNAAYKASDVPGAPTSLGPNWVGRIKTKLVMKALITASKNGDTFAKSLIARLKQMEKDVPTAGYSTAEGDAHLQAGVDTIRKATPLPPNYHLIELQAQAAKMGVPVADLQGSLSTSASGLTDYLVANANADTIKAITKEDGGYDWDYIYDLQDLILSAQNHNAVQRVDYPDQVVHGPLHKNWQELAMQRMLREATEKGYDYIALTNGVEIAEKVGADPEASETAYNVVLRNILSNLSGEKVEMIGLSTGGHYRMRPSYSVQDGVEVVYGSDAYPSRIFQTWEEAEAFIRENNPPPNPYNAVAITDDLYNKAKGAQRLRQDDKAAYTVLEDGKKIITLLEGADKSSLAHELFHWFRDTLTGEELVEAEKVFGVLEGQWTPARLEDFARTAERWLYEGKTKHRSLEGMFLRYREFMLHTYMDLVGSPIDVALSDEAREFFDGMFADYAAAAKDDAHKTATTWERFLRAMSVERMWIQAGMPETGFHIKNRFSQIDMTQTEAGRHYASMMRDVKSDSRVLDAILAYEDRELTLQVVESDDIGMLSAMDTFAQYMAQSLQEYTSLGGLNNGFVEGMRDRIAQKIAEIVPNGNVAILMDASAEQIEALGLDNKELEALVLYAQQLNQLDNINYVHLPLIWFEKYINTNPGGALSALKVLAHKERKSFSLGGLIRDGVIDRKDIKASDIFASYGTRKGNDLGLLKMRNAMEIEGAIHRATPGKQPPAGWYNTTNELFTGYVVNNTVLHWMKALRNADSGLSAVRNMLNSVKVMAFFNPLLLTSYNVVQLGMAALHAPHLLPKALYQGYMDMTRKTPEYWAALDNGIMSQPFPLPWGELRRKLDRIEEAEGKGLKQTALVARRALIGATMGATIGTFAMPGIGTVAGAKYGALIGVSRPIKGAKEIVDNTITAFQSGDNIKLAKALLTAPAPLLREVYELSWDIAWTLDLASRMALNRMYLEQGMTPREAAQQSAKVFGDYASVPPETRRFLNLFLFTPTYKIAMAKLFTDSIQSLGSMATGKQVNTSTRQKAMVTINTLAILFGYDMMMMMAGWERDEFGRRYKMRIISDQEENKGQERELVTVFSGPHDLAIKFVRRGYNSFMDPLVENPYRRFWEQNKWESHPVIRLTADMIMSNFDMNNQEISNEFDTFGHRYMDDAWHISRQLVGILQLTQTEEMGGQGKDLFAQEFGRLEQVVSGQLLFQYSRDPEEVRIAGQMQALYNRLTRAITPTPRQMRDGLTDEEYEKRYGMEVTRRRINEFSNRLMILQQELDEAQLGREIPRQPPRVTRGILGRAARELGIESVTSEPEVQAAPNSFAF